MSDPLILLNGLVVNDDIRFRLNWRQSSGIFKPSLRPRATRTPTAGAPLVAWPNEWDYQPRPLTLVGEIVNQSSFLAARQALEALAIAADTSPCRMQVGSLYQDVQFFDIDDPDTPYKLLGDKSSWHLDGEAPDGVWIGRYGYASGVSQGVIVVDDRPDRTEYLMTDISGNGAEVSFSNPGTAPTYAALMISGLTASTTYDLRNASDPSSPRVRFTTGASETVKYLSPAWRVSMVPGLNYYRLETSTGTLATPGVAFKVALVPGATTFRYLGNSGNRMAESPAVFSFYRRGTATMVNGSLPTPVGSAGDCNPRLALPGWCYSGIGQTYDATKAGVVLEQAATNLCLQSSNLGTTWTIQAGLTLATDTADTTAPDGTSTADKVTVNVSNITSRYEQQFTTVGSTQYTVSFWLRCDSGTKTFYIGANNGVTWTHASSAMTATTSWQRFSFTFTTQVGQTTTWLSFLSHNLSGGAFAATGVYYVWGHQFEAGPFATSAIATTTATVTRNADQCAIARPHNYLRYSRDLTQTAAWSVSGTSSAQPTRAGTVADGTASGNTWTIGNTNNRLYQAITPDCRPNATPWTLVVKLRQGTLTGGNTFDLRIEDQAAALLGSAVTVTASDLSANSTSTYFVSVTAAQVGAATTGLQVALQGKTGTGTVIVESIGLPKGSFPGPLATTEGSAIPLPAYGWDWPTWLTQNATRTIAATLPPISTDLGYAVIGDYNSGTVASMKLCLFRPSAATTGQNYLRLVVATNGTQYDSGNVDVGAVWDALPHGYRITLLNYTDTAGNQYMYVLLDVEVTSGSGTYTRKLTSANLATATTTRFLAGERETLSDGGTIATLRGVSGVNCLAAPAASNYPAGAIPASP